MQYTEIFLRSKLENFQVKKFDIFLIFAQNIDCGYTLEPPCRCFGAKIKTRGPIGPVNAHLRSAAYTNVIENSPSIGADEALGPFFFRIINILSIQVFPFK